jgi:hypothetical protein
MLINRCKYLMWVPRALARSWRSSALDPDSVFGMGLSLDVASSCEAAGHVYANSSSGAALAGAPTVKDFADSSAACAPAPVRPASLRYQCTEEH